MKLLHSRSKSALCLAVVLLFFGLICSCNPPPPNPPQPEPTRSDAPRSDPKEELTRSLKGANVQGYIFETREDDAQAVASLTNPAVRSLIRLEPGTNSVVLSYTSVKDKKSNATKTYKSEVNRAGEALSILVTDFATGEVVSKDPFPVATPHDPAGGPKFDTLEACIADFNCKHRGELQCEANRTCKNQFAALTCCLNNGQCFSVHLIIRPTSLRCQIIGNIPDLEGIVLARP
jgi:hypothetical protein